MPEPSHRDVLVAYPTRHRQGSAPRTAMKPKTAGILLAGVALAGLQYPLWFADDGLLALFRARQEVAQQENENAALRERNRRLAAEVQSLKEGDEEIERLARSELGMIGPDEKMYLLVEEEADAEDPGQAEQAGQPGDPRE